MKEKDHSVLFKNSTYKSCNCSLKVFKKYISHKNQPIISNTRQIKQIYPLLQTERQVI